MVQGGVKTELEQVEKKYADSENFKEIKEENKKYKPGEEIAKHRSNAREIILNSNATPIQYHGDIGYACCFCKLEFADPADLKAHTIENHDKKSKAAFMKRSTNSNFFVKLDITGLQCNICKGKFDTLELMLDHLRKSHRKKIYTDINNRILPFKFIGDSLKCCMCPNAFLNFRSLQGHMSVHYRNYVCDVCDAGFVTKWMLFTHKNVHKIGSFKCDTCESVFDTAIKKKLHERTHKGIKYHKCGFCNERFNENKSKVKHLAKVHGIKNPALKCQACDKSFVDRVRFRIHMKRDHLMERQYKCSECSMEFFSKRELSLHMVKHTGTKDFRCEVCKKAYGRQKTLTEHMKIHNNDRRFKCQHCGQAFVQNCSLKGHLRSKHGECRQS